MCLKWEFTYKTDSRPHNLSSVPFDKRSSHLMFVALLVKNGTMPQMVDDYIASILKSQSTKKPWFPAETLLQYVRLCTSAQYTSTSNSDYKYDVNTGGTIAYYKLSCIAANGHSYIVIAAHDNIIVLGDIEHVKQTEWSFLGLKLLKNTDRWFEKQHMTQDNLKLLEDYVIVDIDERVHKSYGSYLKLVE
uniref:Protein kinase domain-containing protein n=1 Tax=Steinernema glaseri TaxID=37863 RepID=A0A1I8AF28_9BILA